MAEFTHSGKNNPCPVCDRTHQDLSGLIFTRLIIMKCSGKTRKRNTLWECLCNCGNTVELEGHALKSGNTQSCGCLQRELFLSKRYSLKHGKHGTKAYRTWNGIRQRCCNPNYHAYKDYGGRGITLCPEWESFEVFYQDMGDPPSLKHSIERIRNDEGYSPSNCVWATAREQTRNRRNTIFLKIGEDSKSLGEWAEQYAVPCQLLYDRVIRLGWEPIRALTTIKRGA
jgi:hypothetical protein